MAVTARNGFIFQSTKNYGNANHKTKYPNLSKERENNIKRKKDCTLKRFIIFFWGGGGGEWLKLICMQIYYFLVWDRASYLNFVFLIK